MLKRIKSGLITFASMCASAFFVVAMTPEWADFIKFVHDKAINWGVPAVMIALVGVFLSEIWKQILNWHTMQKIGKDGLAGSTPDYDNKLY